MRRFDGGPITQRLARTAVVLLPALALIMLGAACGGSSGDSASATPTATPSPGATPPGSIHGTAVANVVTTAFNPHIPQPSDVLTAVEHVINARLSDAGTTGKITAQGETLTIDFNGDRSQDFISMVVQAPGVRFKAPVIKDGKVQCKDAGGTEFGADTSGLVLSNRNLSCTAPDGQLADVEWQDASGQLNGQTTTLTGAMVPAANVAENTVEGVVGLEISFDADGTALFQQVTAALVNYPLGVFLGDKLLMTPVIVREITDGHVRLAGPDTEGIDAMRAVLVSGELPAPVNITSITLN